MACPSFTTLPTEILEAIFLHLDPQSLVSVSQTNQFIKKLTTEPVIWRHFCKTRFTTWAPEHDIAAKFAGPLSHVDWRALFIRRIHVEKRTLELLDCIIQSQQERIVHINEIANFGYDAKDILLKQYACPDDAIDVLARRYYANATLERIQREMSINVWQDLYNYKNVPLEKALSAYDMFVRVGKDVDFDTFSKDLDRLAQNLLQEYPGFPAMSTKTKASTVAAFLHDQGFRGVSDALYRSLQNSFIGMVLQSATHESLPLISVAVYCALAHRLDLDARPCGFLFHVYCLVYAPKDYNLDGDYKPTTSDNLDFMYIDPFRSSDEVLRGDLQRTLRELGVPSADQERFLRASNTREMVLRTARNIMNAVQRVRQSETGVYGSTWLNAYPDMDNSFYATIWTMIILGPREDDTGLSNVSTRRRQYLPYLLEHFQTHCPWDLALLERYVIPFFHNQPESQRLQTFVQSMYEADTMRKVVNRRDARTENVHFKVGQLFHHRRYQYEGVITGWDPCCDAGEEWIQNMGVDRLPHGRDQAFYHVLVCDKSVRYVAEENIIPAPLDPITRPSEPMLRIAGRHFRRWDEVAHVFVSNVRDAYPDD